MAILYRNKPTTSDDYKTVDIALTGATYDSTLNETIVSVLNTDSNHDAVQIGDYLIPMRQAASYTEAAWSSQDILDPIPELKVINKTTIGTDNAVSSRSISLAGDVRKYFPGNGSSSTSPEGYYSSTGIDVSKTRKTRKYRITDVQSTTWSKFGNLYTGTEASEGRIKAAPGVSFIARNGGVADGSTAQQPVFDIGQYFNGQTYSVGSRPTLNYNINTVAKDGTNLNPSQVAGQYEYVTKYKYQHTLNDIVIQKRGATDNNPDGRWAIWNPYTKEVYFEDDCPRSRDNFRFDSPLLTDSTNRPTIPGRTFGGNSIVGGDTPSIKFVDRTVSVPSDFHYETNLPSTVGYVLEVAHVSSALGLNKPLTNRDIDKNFITLEKNKLAADGSQPVNGNLVIRGDQTSDNINVSDVIKVGGAIPYSGNTGLTLGTKDLEVNNIRLSGVINDDALFRKYKVVSFPHSFMGDYNLKVRGIEPHTVIYFSNVEAFTVGSTITAISNSKAGMVRRVNREYNYIMVSNTNSTDNWVEGDSINSYQSAGPIIKVFEPQDYLLPGQNLRIFGINQSSPALGIFHQPTFGTTNEENTNRPPKPTTPVPVKKFTLSGANTYNYRVAQMCKKTGKISEPSDVSSTVTGAPLVRNFNKTNYIQLTGLDRQSKHHRILVYRKGPGEADYGLIGIYDEADLGDSITSITIEDYGGYDKTAWGTLGSSSDNYKYTIEDSLTYVPVTIDQLTNTTGTNTGSIKDYIGFVGNSDKFGRGFLDTQISSVGLTTLTANSPAFFRIKETELCVNAPTDGQGKPSTLDSPNIDESTFNSPYHQVMYGGAVDGAPYSKKNELEFFIDNSRIIENESIITGGIQKLIQDGVSDGSRTLTLPGGTYYTRLLTLPNNFKFAGESSRNTTLKSIPWMDDQANTEIVKGGNVRLSNSWAAVPGAVTDSPKLTSRFFAETTGGQLLNSTSGSVERFVNVVTNSSSGTITDAGQLPSSKGIFAGVYYGFKSYARSVVEFDGKSNIELSDLTLDGNAVNQSIIKENVSGKSNFVLSGQLAKNVSLKDIGIINGAQGGFYGEELDDAVIEGSSITKGGLRLTESQFATGIYAPGSSKLRLTSNIVESFSNANDLTSNTNSTLVGNIVRDTGSGILGYATSNMISEGNLILGPSDEFIPLVDTLNSEYDQININLINEVISSGNFESDTITFLRDDSPLNMKPITGSGLSNVGISIDTAIRTLVNRGTQTYVLPKTIGNTSFDFSRVGGDNGQVIALDVLASHATEANLADGNIKFKVSAAKVSELAAIADYGVLSTSYESISGRPQGENLIGLVYDINATEYKYMDSSSDIKVNWTGIKVDKNNATQEKITLQISTTYAGLFTVGDRVIFTLPTSGVGASDLGNAQNVGTLVDSTLKDSNGNDIYLGLQILTKTIEGDNTNLILDISDSGGITQSIRDTLINTTNMVLLSEVGETGLTADQQADCRVGVRNRFSITKGRIII